ncbi:hypothetical protein BGX34_000944, partial [Mortierella sp. NVP85]
MPDGHEEILIPDFIARVHNLPVLVAETKRPANVSEKENKTDELKIYCEMKLMLDLLTEKGVEDPEVVGFLIQRGEAVYIPKVLGKFAVCNQPSSIGGLTAALNPLAAVR